MPPFLGCQSQSSFDDTFFPGAQAILTRCVCVFLVLVFFLEVLKECIPDLFNVLCSDKIYNCTENRASLEQCFRAAREAVSLASVLSLALRKLFSVSILD